MGSFATCSKEGMRMTLRSRSALFTRRTNLTTRSAGAADLALAQEGALEADIDAPPGGGPAATGSPPSRWIALFGSAGTAGVAMPLLAAEALLPPPLGISIAYGSTGGFSGPGVSKCAE